MDHRSDGESFRTGKDIAARVKTANARRYIVLHEFLNECGFVDWACKQKDWVFPALHDAESPANAASKRFQRKFREWGLDHGRVEVFHALRHTYKDRARNQKIEERTIALQTGHSLQGVALQYGTKALRSDEMRVLAQMPIPTDWPVSVYKGVGSGLDEVAYRARRDKHIKNFKLKMVRDNFRAAED